MEFKYQEHALKEFSADIIAFKPPNMSWSQFYDRIHRFKNSQWNIDEYCRMGYVLEIMLFTNMKPPILPTRIGIQYAMSNGHIDIIRHFATIGIFPDQQLVNRAAINGHKKIIDFLEKYGIHPTYLQKKHVQWKDYITVAEYTRPELNWEDADIAIENDDLDRLKYLVSLNIFPSKYATDRAIQYRHMEILQYLISINILPTSNAADRAIQYGHLDVLRYLISINILPTSDAADRAIQYGQLDILQYLISINILPHEDAINRAVQYGHLEILKYLISIGFTPTTDAFVLARNYGRTDILRWLFDLLIHQKLKV